MTNNKKSQTLKDALSSVFAVSAILVALAASIVIFIYVFGNPANFEGNNPEGNPLPGNFLAMVYKGGPIVPILLTCLFVLIIFTLERLITIEIARGGSNAGLKLGLRLLTFLVATVAFIVLLVVKSMALGFGLLVLAIAIFVFLSFALNKRNAGEFLRNLQTLLSTDRIEEAIAECDKQRGSIANVAKSTLSKYRALQNDANLDKEQKVLVLQKEFDEAATLEAPMLSKNLVFLSTISSLAVLIGLLGTVFGMIRAFAALAQAGAPDALALANGISEALINTAFGIAGSAGAIILYNYFSSIIDGMTFRIDEAGFSIVETFKANTK